MINKYFLSFIISILPFSKIRKYFYNKIFNFIIDEKSFLGFLTILQSENCKISNSKINSFNFIKSKVIKITYSNVKKFNRINNLNCLSLKNCTLGNYNTIYGNKVINEKLNLLIDKDSIIENFNFFDLNDTIIIQKNCKIGSHCNFWTHGFDGKRSSMIKGSINILDNIGNVFFLLTMLCKWDNDLKITGFVTINFIL